MADTEKPRSVIPGFTPETLNVHPDLNASKSAEHRWRMGELSLEAQRGRDAFWMVLRRPGRGGVALRTFPVVGDYKVKTVDIDDGGGRWAIETHSGTFKIEVKILNGHIFRMTNRFTPSSDLLVAFWPRDLYPLDEDSNPTQAQGTVEAAQRGLNGGYCYLCLNEPAFGSVLYLQNLSELNAFFKATKTKPDGVVGGRWPELGYIPPAGPLGPTPPENPLKAGVEVTISDALMAFRPQCAQSEFIGARNFVDMLADIYPHLTKPEPKVRDWLWRAEQTLHDLKTSPDATTEAFGHRYFHPYVASEYPDSMVQMTVLATLREYEKARGEADPLSEEIAAGMAKFYDDDLQTIRRYLPNVGADKNKDAVDSWYLYHPLMNLARLAINGEDWARKLFFDSLEYGIRVAQHFEYNWPIIYDMEDLSVVEKARDAEGLGQTDAGGIYAYVMLQAHQLTDDRRYIDEGKKALKALEGRRFELAYQTNLTAWGAVACLKLFKLEGDTHYLDQSFTFVASFLHNCELWSSQIEHAEHYANFFGVTCLHDGPYMAAYEAFECFMAADEFIQLGGEALPGSLRLLMCEYWKYAQDVLWSFYPDTFPDDGIAKDIRNGHIDRRLSFPLEDIYGDGRPAGEVGQEIYGAGSAFAMASRAFANCPGAPFRAFTDYPSKVSCGDCPLRIVLSGPGGQTSRVRVLFKDRAAPPTVALMDDSNGEPIHPVSAGEGYVDFQVAADGAFAILWQPSAQDAV